MNDDIEVSLAERAIRRGFSTPEAERYSLRVSVLCPGFIPTGIATSGRNRPPHLSDEARPPSVPRTTASAVPVMTADDVAVQVLDAIENQRFWILTHDRYRDVIVEHAAGIGADARPVPAPIC
jgi:short-subunit dehydrogenase